MSSAKAPKITCSLCGPDEFKSYEELLKHGHSLTHKLELMRKNINEQITSFESLMWESGVK